MINLQSLTPWFAYSKTNARAKLRLFCFPYAGGGAQIYRPWIKQLTTIEVCPAQLPGRGNRIKEPLFTRLTSLVEEMLKEIPPYLDLPFAMFGHSMGAVIGFELARRIRDEHGVEPAHIFISARRAPQIPDNDPITYDLPGPEFIEELHRLQGTPKEVFENPELMQLMIPLLRADFEVCQTYEYKPTPPLKCPMTVFGGTKDQDVPRELLEPWRDLTTGPFVLRMFPGDHFFLHTHETEIMKVLSISVEGL